MVAEQINIYEDFAEFIASLSPEKILAYHASQKIQRRVEYLVAQKKAAGISEMEAQELEKYFMLEHIIRLAKAQSLKLRSQAGKLTDMETIPINHSIIDLGDLYENRI